MAKKKAGDEEIVKVGACPTCGSVTLILNKKGEIENHIRAVEIPQLCDYTGLPKIGSVVEYKRIIPKR